MVAHHKTRTSPSKYSDKDPCNFLRTCKDIIKHWLVLPSSVKVYVLFAWLISYDWKYCWLIYCERKILFVCWKSTAYKPSEQGDNQNTSQHMIICVVHIPYIWLYLKCRSYAKAGKKWLKEWMHRIQWSGAFCTRYLEWKCTRSLEQDAAACFSDFHAIGEEPRRMQYPMMKRWSIRSLAQVEFE